MGKKNPGINVIPGIISVISVPKPNGATTKVSEYCISNIQYWSLFFGAPSPFVVQFSPVSAFTPSCSSVWLFSLLTSLSVTLHSLWNCLLSSTRFLSLLCSFKSRFSVLIVSGSALAYIYNEFLKSKLSIGSPLESSSSCHPPASSSSLDFSNYILCWFSCCFSYFLCRESSSLHQLYVKALHDSVSVYNLILQKQEFNYYCSLPPEGLSSCSVLVSLCPSTYLKRQACIFHVSFLVLSSNG